jgi:phosphoglycolate phosphatase
MPNSGGAGFRADIIFFDNDGTIFDSSTGVLEAVQDGFREFCSAHSLDLPVPTAARIMELTGQPNTVFFPSVLPLELREMAPELRERCLRLETKAIREHGRIYDGAREMLAELRARGKKLVLATHAGEEYLRATVETFGYEKMFDALYHVEMHGLGCKTEMIGHALGEFGMWYSPLAMVGDKKADVDAGHAFGGKSVFCAYGFGTDADREQADYIINAPIELLDLVK